MVREIYKIFELEEVLNLHINNRGASQINASNKSNDSENNNSENSGYPFHLEDEEIDLILQEDLKNDIVIQDNETEEVFIKRVKRYQKTVKVLKEKHGHKCQLCGYTFEMDNGNYYCEAHHIKLLSQDGSQSPENVIIVCANHHRVFHYASKNISFGQLIDGKRIIKIGDTEYKIYFS